MNIQPDDPKWTAYVLGELSETERLEVERELESSAEAREVVEEIRMMSFMLKDELAKEAPAALSSVQRHELMKAAAAAQERKPLSIETFRVPFWKRPTVWATFAAGMAAAVLVFTVAVPSLLRSRQALPLDAGLPAFQTGAPAIAQVAQDERKPASQPDPPDTSIYAEKKQSENKNQPNVLVDGTSAAPLVPAERDAKLRESEARAETQNKDKEEAATARRNVLSGVLGGVLRPQNEQNSQAGQQGQQGQQQFISGPRQSAPPYGNAARAAIPARETLPDAAAPPPPPPPPGPPPAPIRLDVRDRPFNTEAYDRIEDNPFKSVLDNPLSTFSIDVDTASYANMRRFLNQNQLPPKDSVRIEELINYFNYDYPSPNGPHPIGVYTEVASAPWQPQHRLVRVGIKAKEIDMNRRPATNLVFLIDVSGSMDSPQKLPLVKSGLKLLVDQLSENDRVAIVVYAGGTGLVLPPTTGDKKQTIIQTLDRLNAGGSTNGAGGIQLAYETAVANFIRGGVNRVVLCTDGDFNVGITNQGDLTRLIEDKARSGVFLSVLGFGMGNLKDSTMEKLADQGNGNYAYVDSLSEARKVLVEEMGGTLMTVAKDVKIQVDFNPAQVSQYRLIGYENRALRNEDFNDDAKDAGDMGAGHTVTALFEIVPPGATLPLSKVDESKYRQPVAVAAAAAADRRSANNEMLTVRVRYKLPDAADSTRFDVPLVDRKVSFEAASPDYRFAAAVAEFGMILRESPHRAQASMDQVISIAERSKGADRNGYREEFIGLARRARALRDLR